MSLTRTIEDMVVLESELLPVFDILRQPYLAELVVAGQSVNVVHKTECSMIDGKMVSLLLQGDSSTFCHLCNSTRSDANDMDIIKQGFVINKDYKSCQQAWQKLQDGEIVDSTN